MLARSRTTGKLHKVKMTDVEMLPQPNYTIGLDELNKVIAEQKGTTIAGLALKDPNELPKVQLSQEAGSKKFAQDIYKQRHRRFLHKHPTTVFYR